MCWSRPSTSGASLAGVRLLNTVVSRYSMIDWLDFAFMTAATTSAVVAIFEGMRRLSQWGRNRFGATLVICGALWCLGGVAILIYVSSTSKSLKATQNLTSNELPKDWGSKLSPEVRERDSLILASTIYLSSGTLIQYFDLSGARKIFSPSQQQLREREGAVVTFERIDALARNTWDLAFRLGIAALTAGVLGWWAGRSGRDSLANRSFEKDA